MNDDSFFIIVVANFNDDLTFFGELYGVFDKVNDHLFKAPFITIQVRDSVFT